MRHPTVSVTVVTNAVAAPLERGTVRLIKPKEACSKAIAGAIVPPIVQTEKSAIAPLPSVNVEEPSSFRGLAP
jgi:hypothetical protein